MCDSKANCVVLALIVTVWLEEPTSFCVKLKGQPELSYQNYYSTVAGLRKSITGLM